MITQFEQIIKILVEDSERQEDMIADLKGVIRSMRLRIRKLNKTVPG